MERPAYQPLRYDEDWTALADPAQQSDPWDRVKHIPLGSRPGRYISLGGEARERYERYRHPSFGAEPEDGSGYFLQRYLLHADLHLGQFLRGFVQLQSGLESGRTGGPRATDEDRLDLHQAFVDAAWPAGPDRLLILRLGRQEFEFGSSRLVSTRDSLNTRLSFEAVRLLGRAGSWRASAHLMRPVRVVPGFFDDRGDQAQTLWGAYLGRVDDLPLGGSAVLYYSGLAREQARFAQGTADELRHTVGARVWGRPGRWDYNYELAAQLGRFGDGRIRAWDVATDNGLTVRELGLEPRFGLRADVTSGDADPADQTLGTFNALFAGTAYSGLAGLIGPANAVDLAPSLTVKPAQAVNVTVGHIVFWRHRAADGIYGIAGNLVKAGDESRSLHVGNQTTLQMSWLVDQHLGLSATVAYFRAGAFLEETPPGQNVFYTTVWGTYRF